MVASLPSVVVPDVGVTVPPLGLNVIVKRPGVTGSAVHWAYMVVFAVYTLLIFTSVPPVAAVNQPLKVDPVFVGVGNDVSLPSVPVTPDVGVTVPPLGLNVIVKGPGVTGSAVHWAYMVVFAVYTLLIFTSVPPVAAVNQPLKVDPVFVGVGNDVSLPSVPVTPDVGVTVPPLG